MSVLVWSQKNASHIGSGGDFSSLVRAGSRLWSFEEVWSSSFATPAAYSDDDGVTWACDATFTTDMGSWGACYDGTSKVVVVGAGRSGGIGNEMYCLIGGVWTLGHLPTTNAYAAVLWNGTVFCAMPNANTYAATSTTGTAWTARTLPNVWGNDYNHGFCIHGTTFVAVSRNGADTDKCLTSADGATWAAHTMSSSGWNDVVSNGTRIVAVGQDKIAYSDNAGSTWTEVVLAGAWDKVEWNGALFCAVASSTYATSTDGIGWTSDVMGLTVFTGYNTQITVNGSEFLVLTANSDIVGSAAGFSQFWTHYVKTQET